MNLQGALQRGLKSSHDLLNGYLGDLSDADLLVRPAPHANHIAWQLGHLVASEHGMAMQLGGKPPELPAGFAEQHNKTSAANESPQGFASKATYLDLLAKTHQAIRDAVAKMSDADFDKPTTGRMASFAPTLGDVVLLVSNHTLMHAGQFTVVRRKLGKPVLF